MTHFPSTVVPPNVSEAGEDSSTEIDTHESEAEAFELSQYDIDVVEDALDNPDSSEFRDHFGFTIKVETDNEITSSESEQESDTESHYSTTTAERRATSSKRESISRKRSNSLTSTTTSLRTSTSTRPSSQIERPSQVYQERQNKRHSEIYKTEASSSLPSSLTTGPSYYEMLKAKFGMASHDTRTRESPKQLALKEETTSSLEHWKEKNDDYDWEFWASLIPGLEESARTNPQRLHEHLATGIPPPLRGMLWQIFSKSRDTSELENEYRELLKRTSPHEKLIRRDLTRTFPTHTFFQDKEGQGQEMLFHMPDEAAFCVLIKLMSHYGLRGHFTPQMETLHERMYQFNQLLLHFLPQVHRHLDTQGIKPSMYASQWFMTMFAYRCPLELTFRVFDVVFVEGACILLNFALALMKKNQQTLLSLDFESLLDFFHHGVYDVYENDAGTFVRDAYQFDISPRQLAKFSKKYASDTAKEAKLHSQEEQLRRANADLLEQLRQLEHAYDALQEDHQAIAQQVLTANLEMSHMKEENQSLSQKLSQIQQERGHPVPKNALLVDRNSQLEDRLSEVESVLIDFKLKYAQSQTEHETLRQQWQEGQRRISTDSGLDSLLAEYPSRLNFYLQPPSLEITMEEFESFALDRLYGMHDETESADVYAERRKDHISHFVLRLAYCRSESLRNWFLRQESALFKYRFEQERMEKKKEFLEGLSLNWNVLSQKEKAEIATELENSINFTEVKAARKPASAIVQDETYFVVDFEKAQELVFRRSVYVKGGKVYVPMGDQISLLMDEYKVYLLKAMEATAKLLPRMEEDNRLRPILLNVEKQYIGKEYGESDPASGEAIKAADVNKAVYAHAPLCMRHLHTTLHKNHHLRHGGRLQYGLFLKGIGLSINEAMFFWRKAFSELTDDKFQKMYAYNIRYNYGMEGKRANYRPYNCLKIITGNQPSAGDHHGCPFKHLSSDTLENKLLEDNLNREQVGEIKDLLREKHFQLACTRHFELTHSNMQEKADIIEHPNQYYEQSKELANVTAATAATAATAMMEVD
ncbi:eukaryotic and archaeal DNA primase, large subunit-domain-containing protein [Spinellus fusiger]|nr:eukaryotic and archaeal DNA primase, large subunit-domain-containing protein [Spinellus fusiger]